MKRITALSLASVSAVALYCAAAIAAPSAAPTIAPSPQVVVAAAQAFELLGAFVKWTFAHWEEIGAALGSAIAIYNAVRAHQWDRLLQLAGGLAFNVATLTDFDNKTKRETVSARLYAQAGVIARTMFTQAQFDKAVEEGWQLIAKPKLAA